MISARARARVSYMYACVCVCVNSLFYRVISPISPVCRMNAWTVHRSSDLRGSSKFSWLSEPTRHAGFSRKKTKLPSHVPLTPNMTFGRAFVAFFFSRRYFINPSTSPRHTLTTRRGRATSSPPPASTSLMARSQYEGSINCLVKF